MPSEPDDSNLKLHELVDRQGRSSAKGKAAHFVVGSAFKASMIAGGESKQKETPMITLKYQTMRNRNVVVGATVFSFDDKGIAKVPETARLDAAALIRRSNGMATVQGVQPIQVSQKAAPKVKAPESAVQEASEPEIEVVGEPEDVATEETEPSNKPGKKVPPRKSPGRSK